MAQTWNPRPEPAVDTRCTWLLRVGAVWSVPPPKDFESCFLADCRISWMVLKGSELNMLVAACEGHCC